jgi:hypothetical protein
MRAAIAQHDRWLHWSPAAAARRTQQYVQARTVVSGMGLRARQHDGGLCAKPGYVSTARQVT